MFDITENLSDALRRLRLPQARRLLWTDAICIDQDNAEEKGMQIPLMRLIYRRAKKTVIWLGNSDTETSLFVKVIEEIIRKSRSLSASSFDRPTDFSFAENFQDLVEGIKLDLGVQDASWRALARFFDRSWFERIWVIQEVTESRFARAMVGKHEIPWNSIGLVAAWIVTQPQGAQVLQFSKTRGIHNALFICRNEFWIDFPAPHLAVLQSTRNFKATDLRDKVYAMLTQPLNMQERHYNKFRGSSWKLFASHYIPLGLGRLLVTVPSWLLLRRIIPGTWMPWRVVSEGSMVIGLYDLSLIALRKVPFLWIRAPFKAPTRISPPEVSWISTTILDLLNMGPDYTVANIEEVNKLVALKTMSNFQRFDFLSYVHHENPNLIDDTTPSWVPKWEVHTGLKHILASFSADPYNADAGETWDELVLSEPPVQEDYLVIQGLQIGNVSKVSDLMHASDFDEVNPRIVQNIIREHGRDVDTYGPTGTDSKTACIRTLTASQGLSEARLSEKASEIKLRAAMRRLTQIGPSSSSILTSLLTTKRVNSRYILESQTNHEAARQVCHLRKHFVTASGYQGIGPAQMGPDDVVLVVFGGRCPYVIREIEPGAYRLVGECYVHGMMDGEAITEWKAGRLLRETIVLC
ncbi:hypothetical protein EG329_011134 [Mollisiaceae sp. DMI_Dod_QoI]|nr:hypothetical protein EG329_011134 [Helotiales sp. DMI_Dod_QoI]